MADLMDHAIRELAKLQEEHPRGVIFFTASRRSIHEVVLKVLSLIRLVQKI